MQFKLIEVPIQDRARLGRYKASTTWYRYSVHNYKQREILSYQWHPGVEVDFPHLHRESSRNATSQPAVSQLKSLFGFSSMGLM